MPGLRIGETLTSVHPSDRDVKRYGAWLLVALAGLLGGMAVVGAAVGFAHPPLWPAAIVAAAASYGLWSYGRDRMVAAIHDRVEAGVEEFARDERAAEDWHRAGFDHDRTFDPDSAAEDVDDWVWDDPFWTEGEGGGDGRESVADGGTAGATAEESAAARRTDAAPPSAETARSILGVDADADAEEIRRAYRRRVKETHPDLGGSEEAFRRVRRAYERLTD